MALEKQFNELFKCTRCGVCREMIHEVIGVYKICPPYEIYGFESHTARGHVNIARAILDGKLDYSKKLGERIYRCLTCGNCKEHCPEDVNNPLIVRALRIGLNNKGFGPPESLVSLNLNLKQNKNIFGYEHLKRINWSEGYNIPKKGETLYFAGCYASYRYPEIARATIGILKKVGVNVAYLGEEEWCCGVSALFSGSMTIAEEIVEHNIETIQNAGAERVITSCAGCYHTLKSEYSSIVGKLPFNVIHLSELLAGMVDDEKIKFKELKKTVTWHDPCHLGRYEKIYEEPRKIINAIPSVNFVEMIRNKQHAWCCGGGTVTYVVFPQLSSSVATTRVKEASDINADIIVTGCPLCISVLTPTAKKVGIDIYDLSVFIADLLKGN